MKKRILSISLTLALLIGLFCIPVRAAGSFSDTSGHWAEAAIGRWSGYGVVEGNRGAFRPDDALTRAELAAILDRVMGYRDQAENTFSDLGDAWYTGAMLRLNAAGVLEGSNGRAMPGGTVSRQEAAVLLGRALQVEASGAALPFTDAADVASWAGGYVSAMAEAGYLQGYQGAFAPADPVTRASLVTMLDNMVSGFVNEDGAYSVDAAHDLVVNASNVTLKDMTVGGDLIIADGVGDGDVYLDNVKVTGRVILRGCGENSFHILPGTDLSGSAIVVCKTASGGIRLVNESGAPIPMVNVADGRDGVTLTGEFGSVVIASDAPVALKDATVTGAVSVTAAGASLSVTGKSQVARLDVAETAAGTSLKMDKGTVDTLSVAADGLTVDGEAAHTTVSDAVTEKPQTPGGKPAEGGSSSGGGNSGGGNSGGGGGGGNSGDDTPSIVTLTSVAANLASPQAGKTATDAVPAGAGYTVATVWSPALVDGKFAEETAYTATLTFTPTAYYQWADTAPTVAVNNSTSYGGAPTVSTPVLADGKVTVTASYPATVSGLAIVVDGQPESSLTLLEGQYSRRLTAAAHVENSGEKLPNYPVSYQWYTAAAADKTGAAPIVSAADATYELPAGLSVGTYYYFCRMSADGCVSVDSNVAAVSIIESTGEEVLLSNLRLTQTTTSNNGKPLEWPGSLYLTWDFDSNATTDKYKLVCYSGGKAVTYASWNSSTPQVNLQYSLADDTYAAPTTFIDKIDFTPMNQLRQPIGPTTTLDCEISITSQSLPAGAQATLDTTTNKLTVSGLPTGIVLAHVTYLCQSPEADHTNNWGKSLNDYNFIGGLLTEDMSTNSSLEALLEPGATLRILLYTSTVTDGSHATLDIVYTAPLPVIIQASGND